MNYITPDSRRGLRGRLVREVRSGQVTCQIEALSLYEFLACISDGSKFSTEPETSPTLYLKEIRLMTEKECTFEAGG